MSCQFVHESISNYLDDRLAEPERRRLARHLAARGDFGARSKSNDDTLIEIQVDGQGRMVDYELSQGQMTSEIGNLLLFTTFTPATQFLRPTTGKVVIRLSRIVVKG